MKKKRATRNGKMFIVMFKKRKKADSRNCISELGIDPQLES